MDQFLIALEIMGKGMLGIFAAALILWFAVRIMGKLCRNGKKGGDVSDE